MLKSALIEIIQSFTQKELKEFGEYIRSPFFNKSEDLISLFEVIRTSLKSGKPEKLEKEYVYKKLFKTNKYNDGKMRLLMLNLARLAEGFLVQVNIKNEIDYSRHLVNELNNRNLKKNFYKSIKKLEELTDGMEFKSSWYFLNKYIIAGEYDIFNSRERRLLNIKDAPDDSLLAQSEYVALFFMLVYLDRSTYLLNMNYLSKAAVDVEIFENMLAHLCEKHAAESVLIMVKYKSLLLMLKGGEEQYYSLKEFVFNNLDGINPMELYNSVIRMQNFCNEKYHKGDMRFLNETFELEKLLVERDLVMPPDALHHSPVRYKNTVVAALKFREYEWAKRYMEKYKSKLMEGQRDNAYNYCCARLEFEAGNFSSALEKLSLVQNEDLNYKVEIKVFLLKLYYELGMEEQAEDLCNSFRQFLINNKLLRDMYVQVSSNFIRLILRLFRVKSLNDPAEAAVLIKEIENTSPLVGKDWLIEKARELTGEKYIRGSVSERA
jgi:hypothetical protein